MTGSVNIPKQVVLQSIKDASFSYLLLENLQCCHHHLLPSPSPRKPGRPAVYSSEKKRRENLERKRAQSKVYIKEQTRRWMSLRETLNVFSRAEVADFLLDL